MEKLTFQLNSNTQVGANSSTALNVLIGANCEDQYRYELKKIDSLNKCNLPISIVSDLSLYKKTGNELWRQIIKDHKFVAGTVPIYQAVSTNQIVQPTQLLDIIHEHAECGVKLMTIHPTPDFELLEMCKHRLVPITSRGGAIVSTDMLIKNTKENVYLQIIDEIIKVAAVYNVTLSIGSSFRSANLHDAMDHTYLLELTKQLKFANYCRQFDVNTIIETPGHASPQNIFSICNRLNQSCPYPIMPLGPMPTDCALKQDDLAAAIGAVLMGTHGCADILSVVTCEEHIGGIPTIDSLISAIEKYSIAKHIIDIYKLHDVKEDSYVSLERSKHNSCIWDGKRKCTRCKNMCPLNLSNYLKRN